MDDMNDRPGPHEGPTEHLAAAGGSSVGDHEGSTSRTSGDGPCDELMHDARDEPSLAAFLDRTVDVLQAGPDEFTAHRHLVAMRKEAAKAVPARPRVLRTASISAAAAVALVVTLAGFGALPAPAQQVLSDVADRVGITIPSPADRDPSGEVPAKQQPDPETIPDRPGGPDRSDLPGLTEDGSLRTPGARDETTPPGQSGDRPSPGSGRDQAPGRDRSEDAPGAPGESPTPELPPATEGPPDPPPPPEPPDVEDPPASGRGSGASGGEAGPGGQSGGDRR